MSLSSKLIINAAITGAVLSKADTPFLPAQIDEIVTCAQQVHQAGAAIVHVHARKSDESNAFDPDIYRELVAKIRQTTDLIVCVSLSGRHVSDVTSRAAGLAAQPDMASLTLGSMNFITQPSINSPDTIRELAKRIYDSDAIPELEIFEAGFINFANYLIKKEVLKPPYYFNLLLGSLGAAPLDLLGLGHMVNLLPPNAIWSVGGLGRYQLDANVMSIAAGGHVRVGIEDNIYYDRDRTILADNVHLVERIVRIAHEMGREPATPDEARQVIGLPAKK
ncbi:MAG: 3-keto-5-aminohexanoate cleavage protein [Chloroflexota bacterium]